MTRILTLQAHSQDFFGGGGGGGEAIQQRHEPNKAGGANNRGLKIIRECTGSQYTLNIIGLIESHFFVKVTM